MLKSKSIKIWLASLLLLLVIIVSASTEAANVFYASPESNQTSDLQSPPTSFNLTYSPTIFGVSFEGRMVDFPYMDGQIAAFISVDGQEVCVGVSKIDPMKGYKLTVYGDDPSTDTIDGAREGDKVNFKVIVSGKPALLILAEGSDEPVWFFNKDKKNINLCLEKNGMMSALTGGGAGGGIIIPAVFSDIEVEEETGGFGIPLTSEDTKVLVEPLLNTPVVLLDTGTIPISEPTPLIPEPNTLFMVAAGLIGLRQMLHAARPSKNSNISQ